jgi:hypothetical protein
MKFLNLRRMGILAVAASGLVLVAGCGGTKTDVSAGVDQFNTAVLAAQGAELDCPKEIDGGEGTEFDCDLNALEGDGSETVTLKVTKEGDKLAVDIADQAAFNQALQTVTGG